MSAIFRYKITSNTAVAILLVIKNLARKFMCRAVGGLRKMSNVPTYLEGVWQLGKKVLATILAVCARVMSANGLKYGRFCGSHGSNGPPHG